MRIRTIIPAALGSLFVATQANDARACGGCFHPPTQSGTVVTDHRMVFSISPTQTTLYDEIKYSGSPKDFAWVLPVHGQVTIGLSSDVVFSALEQATQTNIIAPQRSCPSSFCSCGPMAGGGFFGGGGGGGGFPGGGGGFGGMVMVTSQQTIGPYATVQLKSTDPNALNAWLTANGYDIPTDVQPIIAAYVTEGFDFVALKLAPGQGIQAMRPVRVTTPGAGLSLPLRMVAAGTGATVGITLWIIADGRYEPKNFQFFTISATELTWDWSVNRSDYTTVQARKEVTFNNAAWQIESSLSLSPLNIETTVLQAMNDYMAVSQGDGGSSQTPAQAQLEDLGVLFPEGNMQMRITRLRSDMAHAALATDLVLQAAADQTAVSNTYPVTQSVNVPPCPPPQQCNCGGGGSSGVPSGAPSGAPGSTVSSSSGASGSSGGGAAGDGGVSINGLPPARHGGCAVSISEPGTETFGSIGVGIVGMALLRARRKRS
jgi:hypothetical protein